MVAWVNYANAQTIWYSITGYIPNTTSFLPFLGLLVAFILLLLFGPCLLNLLVKFVSSRLQEFQVKLMMIQGFQPTPRQEDPSAYKALDS